MNTIIKPSLAFLFFCSLIFLMNAQVNDIKTLPLQIEARRWVKDQPNQPWSMYDTEIMDNLKGYKSAKMKTNLYGSWKKDRYQATGFFRIEKINDRWWFIDPQGYPNIQRVVNGLRQGPSDQNKAAFSLLFKDSSNWIKSSFESFNRFGFNGIGAWSNTEAILAGNNSSETKLSYSLLVNFMSAYGKMRGGTYQLPGNIGYPNQCVFVFDPAFETFCDENAKVLVKFKNDPNLVGYFSDNELPFGLKNLEGYLSLPDSTDSGRRFAEKWLKEKGIIRSQVNDAYCEEFAGIVADYYYRIVSKSIRKYDANHLYLGSRLHGSPKNTESIIRAAGRYCDVVSINYYGAWSPDLKLMDNWGDWAKKPFIITEFYTKAMDSGLANTTGAGFTVHTQQDRGYAYQNFCLGLLKSKNCVGWHWFKYQDNDPEAKGVDPSNIDSNKGLLSTQYKWYMPMIKSMKQLNINVYSLIKYFDQKDTSNE